jgi:hypothetical protein
MLLLLNQCLALMLVVLTMIAAGASPARVVIPFGVHGAQTSIATVGNSAPVSLVTTRDKTETNAFPINSPGSPTAKNKPNASCVTFEAEGMGR